MPTGRQHTEAEGMPSSRTWDVAQPWTSLVARLVVAGFLGLAGLLKLPDPAQSVRAVRAYDLLPEGVVQVVGYRLPVLEVALAGLLLVGLATRFAAVASAVLMVAFLVGVASAAVRGLAIDCGCFGGGGVIAPTETRYTAELLRDAALLGVCLLLVRWPHSPFSVDALLEEEAIRLEHRPIAMLDGYSTDRYASRALNAAACVADADVAAYPAFSDGLLAAQPPEGGPGLTDSRTTDDASRAGVTSTPTILVGGAPLQEWTDEALRSAVSAARTQG